MDLVINMSYNLSMKSVLVLLGQAEGDTKTKIPVDTKRAVSLSHMYGQCGVSMNFFLNTRDKFSFYFLSCLKDDLDISITSVECALQTFRRYIRKRKEFPSV